MESFWKLRKVFVTGINGFVGSHVARGLRDQGARVVGLLRDEETGAGLELQGLKGQATFVRGSTTDYFLLERILNEYEIDTVFHLAAQALVGVAARSPRSTFESNIMGTWNVLEACRLGPLVKRVIVASSDKAYGDQEALPCREEQPLNGTYPYDASKACTDILCRSYHRTYGLPVAITRFVNIYGEGDLNFSRLIPDTIRSVIWGIDPIIRSDGTNIRDYVYIQDAMSGYLALGEKADRGGVAGEAFNFGAGSPLSVLELVNLIIDISGRTNIKPKILSLEKIKNEIVSQYLDSTKAAERLGWRPAWSLQDALARTYRWYESYLAEKK
jgi:CDP-glucose 4,6-dehydratase